MTLVLSGKNSSVLGTVIFNAYTLYPCIGIIFCPLSTLFAQHKQSDITILVLILPGTTVLYSEYSVVVQNHMTSRSTSGPRSYHRQLLLLFSPSPALYLALIVPFSQLETP